jgi:predicted flap endonuclease-1-like 5' DNA nuclease
MIRSLFGLSKSSTDDTETGPDEGDVTVEREAVDAETEAAVKGTDEADEVAEADEAADEVIEEAEPEPETEAEPEVETEPETTDGESDAEPTEGEETEREGESTEDAEPAAGADVSVEEINGIGPTYSERLAEAGIGTVAALAESDPATVAEAAQASESRAEEWIDQATGWA